jgi:hypothetical protein
MFADADGQLRGQYATLVTVLAATSQPGLGHRGARRGGFALLVSYLGVSYSRPHAH